MFLNRLEKSPAMMTVDGVLALRLMRVAMSHADRRKWDGCESPLKTWGCGPEYRSMTCPAAVGPLARDTRVSQREIAAARLPRSGWAPVGRDAAHTR